jgi:hypothetical protein
MGQPPLKTLQEVRDVLQTQLDAYDFVWLTGGYAIELVDATLQTNLLSK